ncbi:DivIVA domain-containing protein [Nitrospinota bacterium]
MKITGADIRKQEFPRKIRGFDPLDVNAFLQFVADAVDQLQTRNAELTEQCAEMSDRIEELQERDQRLQQSLQAVNDLREEVKTRAENLLKSSEKESMRMRKRAEEDSARIRQEAEWNSRRLRDDVSSLEKLREKAIFDLAELLRSHGRFLEHEAERLGIDLSSISGGEGGKVVPINHKAESEGS